MHVQWPFTLSQRRELPMMVRLEWSPQRRKIPLWNFGMDVQKKHTHKLNWQVEFLSTNKQAKFFLTCKKNGEQIER